MSSKYKESKNKDEVFGGENYNALPRSLEKGQKDYTGLILGNCKVLEPIFIDDYDYFLPSPGWLCQDINSGLYKIIPNLALSRIYTKYCSDKTYFGMEYVSSDFSFGKLNSTQFKQDFLCEVEKEHSKRHDEYSNEKYLEYKRDIDKYVENVLINIHTLKELSHHDFEKELSRVIKKYHFKEVDDISSYKNCLYLIVLDEYKQFYVGKAVTSLKNRMRKHWTAKIIPAKHLWNGGFEASRIKFDDFKMFDATRIFVCEDIKTMLIENKDEASDRRIEINNTAGFDHFDEMNDLAKAERIVINNCKCVFCLSDRTPLMNSNLYDKLEVAYNTSRFELLIKQYLRLDEENPYKARF